MAELQLKNITLTYGNNPVLQNFALQVPDGELVSLLGPSGCGKTTTLRIIAGLLQPDSGQILVDHNDIAHVPVYKRQFGMVFQSYALFPHLTVWDNVAFGLKQQKIAVTEINQRVTDTLALVGLENLVGKYPHQLSGGQQQRVSLARALVVRPRLLLMDEPLSNLDAKLRIEMREEIRRLQQQLHMTVIFVTHDQEECFAISDRVSVMNQGKIEQYATPQQIYQQPQTEFVARFIGFQNFIDITQKIDTHHIKCHNLTLKVDANTDDAKLLTIRPQDIKIQTSITDNSLAGTIQTVTYLGNSFRYSVKTPIGILKVDDSKSKPYTIGTTLKLQLLSTALLPLTK